MYNSLFDTVLDLESKSQLLRIKEEVDPYLEVAQIHRDVFKKNGPAILFENIKGSPFPALSNLFGTEERVKYLFKKEIKDFKNIVEWKNDPIKALKNPKDWLSVGKCLYNSLPQKKKVSDVLWAETTLDQLPQIQAWPKDGGAFIFLPQVYSEDVLNPGWKNSNLGMYRIQISGNEYAENEIGLHYQLHRGIGNHHKIALENNEPFRVSIFVGGPPAHTFAAVMPLPEGLSELLFAGMLGAKRFGYQYKEGHFISSDADFCIVGVIDPKDLKNEGPFGDHLGYYSLKHPYPVMKVEKVYHRQNAIWPFTVVQRPPAEDSYFGMLVHELTGKAISSEIPGVKELHAVDIAGVHPLLIAKGTERYLPYLEKKPRELLTQANAILGFGQCSLAKYLFIVEEHENKPNIHDLDETLTFILERIDLKRDLHFQTKTTIDTLDYSGTSLNEGSKLVIPACGEKIRELTDEVPSLSYESEIFLPGVLMVKIHGDGNKEIELLIKELEIQNLEKIPLIVILDDLEKVKKDKSYFYWALFTRSNPSHDIYGTKACFNYKHWECEQLIIDARKKIHHAPELEEDEMIQIKSRELLKKYDF